MGNNKSIGVPQNFKETCHPSLTASKYEKKQEELQIPLHHTYRLTMWRANLYPLLSYNKHLFLPTAFRQDMFQVPKCCSSSLTQSPTRVCYDPYIYTLKNQITARKFGNRVFREHELWKILKSATLALRDWEYVYPDISIGKLIPQNFLINDNGRVKIAHRFSFPEYDQSPIIWTYLAPELRQNAIVRYTLKDNGQVNQNTLASIYSLGITLLQSISLQQSEFSAASTKEKKKILKQSPLYNKDLIQIILRMSQDNLNLRPNLLELQMAIKHYRQVSRENN